MGAQLRAKLKAKPAQMERKLFDAMANELIQPMQVNIWQRTAQTQTAHTDGRTHRTAPHRTP